MSFTKTRRFLGALGGLSPSSPCMGKRIENERDLCLAARQPHLMATDRHCAMKQQAHHLACSQEHVDHTAQGLGPTWRLARLSCSHCWWQFTWTSGAGLRSFKGAFLVLS